MSSSAVSDLIAWFLPVHRYTTMGDSYGSVCVGLSVPVSVHHKCSIEMTERIELVFGMGASFHLSYTVLKGNSGNSKITVLPSETLSRHINIISINCLQCSCLQCFDAVGWVAGRASGL